MRSEHLDRHDAVRHHDTAVLRDLVGELHEADTGDLIEALIRNCPSAHRADGQDFDFRR
jgi:hypothetical protein